MPWLLLHCRINRIDAKWMLPFHNPPVYPIMTPITYTEPHVTSHPIIRLIGVPWRWHFSFYYELFSLFQLVLYAARRTTEQNAITTEVWSMLHCKTNLIQPTQNQWHQKIQASLSFSLFEWCLLFFHSDLVWSIDPRKNHRDPAPQDTTCSTSTKQHRTHFFSWRVEYRRQYLDTLVEKNPNKFFW